MTVVVGDSVFRQVNAISFTKPVNGANPLPQTVQAASTGTDFQFTVSATTATGGAWLSVVNASFNGCSLCTTPESFRVVVNAAPTMPIGSYTGQIVFTARDGTQSLTVPVTLTVADPTAGAIFDNLPGQVSFSFPTGGSTPPAQALQIRNAGSGTLSWTLDTSTSDGGNWLNAIGPERHRAVAGERLDNETESSRSGVSRRNIRGRTDFPHGGRNRDRSGDAWWWGRTSFAR